MAALKYSEKRAVPAPEIIDEMRAWLIDIGIDPEVLANCSSQEVLQTVDRRHEMGVRGFLDNEGIRVVL